MPRPNNDMAIRRRVDARRKEAGITRTELANMMGTSTANISRLLSDKADKSRPITLKWAEKFASALDCSVVYLLEGAVTVGVVGYVGAGECVVNFDDQQELDQVESPAGLGLVAVRVRDDSMLPKYEEGSLLFFRPTDHVAADCIGRTCIVQVKDGPTLVKKLQLGSKPGRYRLASVRAKDIEDVELVWAARVRWSEEP